MRIVHLAWRITSLWNACMCRWELVHLQQRASSRKNLQIAEVYRLVRSSPVESFRKKIEMVKDSQVEASSRRSENSAVFISNWSFFKWITVMTSADSYRCYCYCLARVFQNLPAHPSTMASLMFLPTFKVFSKAWFKRRTLHVPNLIPI